MTGSASQLRGARDPGCIATEGALWGSVKAHGLLPKTVIVSDDAGRFNVGLHGLCRVHANRLVHKLDTFTDQHRTAQQRRVQFWRLYKALKGYPKHPSADRKAILEACFDRIFRDPRSGFVPLDRLLARLHNNKSELLRVLERPEIPLHTNGSENDLRSQVTRQNQRWHTQRCRTGLSRRLPNPRQDRRKLGFTFWDYLGARLAIPGQTESRISQHRQAPLRHVLSARTFAPLTYNIVLGPPARSAPPCPKAPSGSKAVLDRPRSPLSR